MSKNKPSSWPLAPLNALISSFLLILSGASIASCPETNKSNVIDSHQFLYDSRVSIEFNEIFNDVSLNIHTNCRSVDKKIEIAKFYEEGSAPNVEKIFLQKINERENIFAIVSWKINSRGDGTYGTYYEVHAYQKSLDGEILENSTVSSSQYMSGIDGYQMGQESKFTYKTEIDVKNFWKKRQHHLFQKKIDAKKF